MTRWSVIIPVLNEAGTIGECLAALQPLREQGHEVIVVDGGSKDATAVRARGLCDHCLVGARTGRAAQMHEGALRAQGEMLLFLHADTRLPEQAPALLAGLPVHPALWGRFDVRLSGRRFLLRVIAAGINLRSRCTGIATGDQAMFLSRALYHRVGGFPPLALMEDVALSGILKAHRAPLCLRQKVTTSSRRWERHGIVRTVIKMWFLRGLYRCGVSTEQLASWYGS